MTPSNLATHGVGGQVHPWHLVARLVRGYRWLASRETLSCIVILVFTLGLRAALLPWLSVPQPAVHDEFSYLLAADTYVHGRLTNPPHPFWQHFETFHVLMQPTYASKYQPLQGLVLAFGQKFFGIPWVGVYLSSGLMCAALCWMLQGWIAPSWALLGALIFAVRVGVLSYWMNSYFGGAVAGIGGALVLGAMVRIWRRGQFGHSTTWALGLAILALSRPYDAAGLGCACAAILVWSFRKSHTPFRIVGLRWALPALIVLTLCAGAIAYNDYRVTGSALTLPYQAHDRQYAMVSMFMMMPLRPEPIYRHAVMRQFWAGWNVEQREFARAFPLTLLLRNYYFLGKFLFPFWVLILPIFLWPYDQTTVEERAAAFLLAVFALMILPLIGVQSHYAAAFAGVFYLRFLQSLVRFRLWRPWNRPVGRVLGGLLVVLLAGGLCNDMIGLIRYGEVNFRFTSRRDTDSQESLQRGFQFESDRRSILQALKQQPGPHLVLLRYAPSHDHHQEWVFNAADIDASPIVWAREMGPAQDRPFLEYFRHRKVWLLEPDQSPPKLTPYPRQEQAQP